jgi:putative aldouronate transport system substrate-binding protein
LSTGFLGATGLKSAGPDRVKELPRILNYLAAPFGSEEDLLLTSGIKDIDYRLDDRGNPVLTDRGNMDANYVPWKYVVQHPHVIYVPDIPNYAKTLSEAEQFLIPAGVSDPTLGYYSPTSSSKGPVLNQAVGDCPAGDHRWSACPYRLRPGGKGLGGQRWRTDPQRIRRRYRCEQVSR